MNELREKECLREEYHAYTKECRRKWQYQMTYEQWLAHQLITERRQYRAEIERLQKKVKALKRTADLDEGYIESLEKDSEA